LRLEEFWVGNSYIRRFQELTWVERRGGLKLRTEAWLRQFWRDGGVLNGLKLREN
jgi:hypothetical protein